MKEAISLLDSIKSDCPRRWELLSAHFKIGQLYEKIGKPKKAISHYKKIAKIEQPMKWEIEYTFNRVAISKFEALESLAKIYLQHRKFAKANDYALRYLMARRNVIGCGFSFMEWRTKLLHLQLSIAFAQEDYEDAHLLMRRFSNTYRAISMNDELIFPLFLKLVDEYYTESERQQLMKESLESIKDGGIGLVAKYDLIRIAIWNDNIKKNMEFHRSGTMELKYLQSAAGRVLEETLSEKNLGL